VHGFIDEANKVIEVVEQPINVNSILIKEHSGDLACMIAYSRVNSEVDGITDHLLFQGSIGFKPDLLEVDRGERKGWRGHGDVVNLLAD